MMTVVRKKNPKKRMRRQKKKDLKRKKEAAEAPPKKQKLDESQSGEVITLFVGGLQTTTSEEEVQQFFTDNEIELSSVRKPPNKRNAFADLADNSDLDKALGLSGSDFQNNSLTVEKAKPRQPRQDNNSSFGGYQSFNSSFGGDEKDSRTLFCKGLP